MRNIIASTEILECYWVCHVSLCTGTHRMKYDYMSFAMRE